MKTFKPVAAAAFFLARWLVWTAPTLVSMRPEWHAWIGLALERTGGSESEIDADKLLAFGETGPFTAENEEEPLTGSMLLAGTFGIGELGSSPDASHGQLVMLANGDSLLFGAEGTNQVLRMPNLDEGAWEFSEYAALPDYDNDGVVDAHSRFSAVLVNDGEAEWVVIAGGDDATTNVATFDATTGAFRWASSSLALARTDHQSTPLPDGKVLLVGGRNDEGSFEYATFEVFDPFAEASFANGTLEGMSGLGFGLTTLTNGTTVVCGGGIPNDNGTYTDPLEECRKILTDGTVEEIESLPVGLQGLAMATLPDGRVLAAGGASQRAYANSGTDATARAFVYDPTIDMWTEVGGMAIPRAHARMLPSPDGRMIVLGGTSLANLLSAELGDAVSCLEIFDPGTFTFNTSEPCALPGSGANPRFAAHPSHGAVVINGPDGESGGGTNLGVIGFGPNF